jgi:hypothetical protein
VTGIGILCTAAKEGPYVLFCIARISLGQSVPISFFDAGCSWGWVQPWPGSVFLDRPAQPPLCPFGVAAGAIAATYGTQLFVLLDMQKPKFGPFLTTNNRILVSGMRSPCDARGCWTDLLGPCVWL